MKSIFHFLLFFLSIKSTGQTIEKYYNYNWKECLPNEARFYCLIVNTDSGYVRTDYFIHEKRLQMAGKYSDIDSKIPNGYFQYYHSNGIISSLGKYINGKKEGVWIHFHSNGMMSDSITFSTGNRIGTGLSWHPNGYLKDSSILNTDGTGVKVSWFDNGNISSAGYLINQSELNGTWKYYHKNGQLSSMETFKLGSLTSKRYFDESGNEITDTTNRDKEATFPGGLKAWQNYLLKKAYFPTGFRLLNSDKAIVVVSFAINEEGVLEDVYVSTPFYPEFDKIALTAILNSPKWKPAISNNRKVKFWMRQPIMFSEPD